MIFKRIILGLITILLLCLIINFTKQTLKLWRAGKILEIKKAELENLKKTNLDLKKELEKVQGPDFVEEVAREKLGMAKEGERVIIIPPINTNKSISADEIVEPNWKKWWKAFFD